MVPLAGEGPWPEDISRRLRPEYYFDLSDFAHRELFTGVERVWEVLPRLRDYLAAHLRPALEGTVMPGAWVEEDAVYLGPGAVVEPGAYVKGPAIIGPGTIVRHGAYIREHCLIGAGCVVGHATELKSAILLDGAQAPHFNYVGDSILGRRVNLGAGTKLSNFKNDGSEVKVRLEGHELPTGLRKFGAVIGDGAATGCNCVTSPGTLVGPGVMVYGGAVLRGAYRAHTIVKLRQEHEAVSKQRAGSAQQEPEGR